MSRRRPLDTPRHCPLAGHRRDRSDRVAAVPASRRATGRVGGAAVLVLALMAMAAGLVWRTYDLQFLQAEGLVAWGEDHRIRTTYSMGLRGDVLDRTGEPLATSLEWATVYADPSLVDDPLAHARKLAPELGIEVMPLAQQLSVPGEFVYLERQVPPEKAERIKALGLEGIATLPEARRVYPLGDLATEILGTVSLDHNGMGGIEYLYNDLLTGTPGSLVREEYPGGRSVPGGQNDFTPAVKGSDLRLTIDRLLQFETARVLSEQVRKTDAQSGVIILSRPATGEILAMSTAVRSADGEILVGQENRALTWTFEPGSVLKGLSFSAILGRRPGRSLDDSTGAGPTHRPRLRVHGPQSPSRPRLLGPRHRGEVLQHRDHSLGAATRRGVPLRLPARVRAE